MAAQQMADNARHTTRRKQLKSAIILFNNRHSTMPASVRDISETGARLEAVAQDVPDTFELIVELDGLVADCEVVWRKVNFVGVRFLSPPRKAPPKRIQVVQALGPAGAPTLRRKPR
jgi:PilZ domain